MPWPASGRKASLLHPCFSPGRVGSDGGGAPGAGTGAFSFKADLDGHVLVRRNVAVMPNGRHEDLMVVYRDPQGLRATYFDNEGNTIQYAVSLQCPRSGRIPERRDAERAAISADLPTQSGRHALHALRNQSPRRRGIQNGCRRDRQTQARDPALSAAFAAAGSGVAAAAVGICDGVPTEAPHDGQNLWDEDNSLAQKGHCMAALPKRIPQNRTILRGLPANQKRLLLLKRAAEHITG